MLNQFEYFGIKTPARRAICKEYIKQHPVKDLKELENIVRELWKLPQREFTYFAIDLFASHKTLWKKSSIKLIEWCITQESWWESVDNIASLWTGPYFKTFPEQIIPVTGRWNKSKNLWLQRSSLMFQKAYKKETNTTLLSRYILCLADEGDFFIRKAIGWILREYGKTNPQWVKDFVRKNKLSPLSKKEALKNL